jgi:hypothetical protein
LAVKVQGNRKLLKLLSEKTGLLKDNNVLGSQIENLQETRQL